ncbi:MAG: protein translocase subunit SecD [Caulobacteraceae bacterium]
MLTLSRWKVILVVLAVLFGVVFTLPNALPQKTLDALPSWVPKQKLNLGLDLQGGSSLLLEVDTKSLKAERLTNLLEDVRNNLRNDNVAFDNLHEQGDAVMVHIMNAADVDKAFQTLTKLSQPIQNTATRDLQVSNQPGQVIQLALSDQAMQAAAAQAVEQSIEKIRRRVDELGTKEPSITTQGTNRISVEAPGESDPEKLKAIIGKTAKLTFQAVDDQVTAEDMAAGRIPPDDQVLPMDEARGGGPIVVKKRAVVDGNMLTDARQAFDSQTGGAVVSMRFNGQGADRFGKYTAENIGKRFAIVLDGKILSAPVIQGAIPGGSGQITGIGSAEEANTLSVLLRAGALPAPLIPIQQSTVGAELGADSVARGELSAVVGFLVIVAFIVLAYGLLFGGVAFVALSVNGLLLLATMSATQATLTLPGVAGLILSLALAVDASVLIYERMRDEARAGHSALAAADHGMRRALISIVDANVTTLIAGAIMFNFGAGPVRGFAWSLSVGVFTSVFSAVFVTQVLLGWWFKVAKPKTLPIL